MSRSDINRSSAVAPTNITLAVTTTTTALSLPPIPVSTNVLAARKLCHIVKRPNFEGYGFNLHSEKIKPGQYIGKVDMNSPAEMAGLKEGDRIIEVNGIPIFTETHRQVVQRIKAISSEVRLLLIDVDGIASSPLSSPSCSVITPSHNIGNSYITKSNCKATAHEIPDTSPNISSIDMVSTKRMPAKSPTSTNIHHNNNNKHILANVTNSAVSSNNIASQNIVVLSEVSHNIHESAIISNNNNNNSNYNNKNNNNDNNNGNHNIEVVSTIVTSPPTQHQGLQLPTTAAEMRAKLLSKKKYDPKNESVDFMKKFEIIQKL